MANFKTLGMKYQGKKIIMMVFLFQCLSIALKRGNAVAFLAIFDAV